jgi:hypothetical protein
LYGFTTVRAEDATTGKRCATLRASRVRSVHTSTQYDTRHVQTHSPIPGASTTVRFFIRGQPM